MTTLQRNILVTGASSGIGRAITERVLSDGHSVLGIARDFSKFPCTNSRFTPVSIDLEDLDALPARLDELARVYTDIDVLICNAGRGRFGSLEEFSYRQIRSLTDLNFVSHAYVVRAFLSAMKTRRHGDIIFTGSEAALAGGRKGAVYSATKFALRGFAQALREECGRTGVRVCIINPGTVDTPFFDALNFGPGSESENTIHPEDIGNAVAMVLTARPGTVFDEINLSPLKKVLQHRKS